jgi:hypothetical protein
MYHQIVVPPKDRDLDIAIHFTSNHLYSHKMAGFYFYINRINHIISSQQTIKQEWDKIINMPQNYEFPVHLIHSLRNRITKKKDNTTSTQRKEYNNNIWITFTYHSPSIHKVTNLFRRTNMKTAFRPTNTIYQQLVYRYRDPNPSGIYQQKCNTCNNAYVGQSSRPITKRHKEHIRYIHNNNHTSA